MKTNNYLLHSINMGGSIVWADQDLVVKNGNADLMRFNYDDACKYQDGIWRLPTLAEMLKLLSNGFEIKYRDKEVIGLSISNNHQNIYLNFDSFSFSERGDQNPFYILKDTDNDDCYCLYLECDGFSIVKQSKKLKGRVLYVKDKVNSDYAQAESIKYFDGVVTTTDPVKLEGNYKNEVLKNTIPVDYMSRINMDVDSKYWETDWYKEQLKSVTEKLQEKETEIITKECDKKLISEQVEKVNHPKHYTWFKEKFGIEPYEILQEFPYNLSCCLKYVIRNGKKFELGYKDTEKQIEDLQKAIKYLEFEIERLQK